MKISPPESMITALPDGTIIGYEPLIEDTKIFSSFLSMPEVSGFSIEVYFGLVLAERFLAFCSQREQPSCSSKRTPSLPKPCSYLHWRLVRQIFSDEEAIKWWKQMCRSLR